MTNRHHQRRHGRGGSDLVSNEDRVGKAALAISAAESAALTGELTVAIRLLFRRAQGSPDLIHLHENRPTRHRRQPRLAISRPDARVETHARRVSPAGRSGWPPGRTLPGAARRSGSRRRGWKRRSFDSGFAPASSKTACQKSSSRLSMNTGTLCRRVSGILWRDMPGRPFTNPYAVAFAVFPV